MSRIGSQRVQVLPPILEAAAEAYEQACAQFHCINSNDELSANAARQFLQELADFVERMGKATGQVGDKVVEEIYLMPGAAEVFHRIGRYVAAPAAEIEDGAAQIDREHEDNVRHMELEDDRANAWDRRVNRPQ